MSVATPDRLLELLPALYRERDALEGRDALRGLLRLIGDQAALLQRDVAGLWDELFVETCRDWVVPYIGDLVDNELLADTSTVVGPATAEELFLGDLVGPWLRAAAAVRPRADVAKTISYRRRKGTLAMLEELARDVTGWPVHAVEFFQLLGWTQHLAHLRPWVGWTDVHSLERMDRIGGPFDDTSHTVDVRPPGRREGWYGIPKIGLFLWRLQSFPLENVPAPPASEPWRFHFSPLGNPAPLFARRRREAAPSGLATELDVGGPIRPAFFYDDVERHRATAPPRPDYTSLYGLLEPVDGLDMEPCPDCSLFVFIDGQPVPADDVFCSQLRPWPVRQPNGRDVAVDVVNGRLALGTRWQAGSEPPRVDVSFHYGSPAALGGGGYERGTWLVRPERAGLRLQVAEDAAAVPGAFASVGAAINDWENRGRPPATISILDSRTYTLPARVELPNDGSLTIEAANMQRPLLRCAKGGLRIAVVRAAADDPRRDAQLALSGVVVEGSLRVVGDLARLRLLHATLVPGRRLLRSGDAASRGPSIFVRGRRGEEQINGELRIEAAFSVTGRIIAPEHIERITLLDSIVDGVGGAAVGGIGSRSGPPLVLERSTLFGGVHVRSLEASETIFTGVAEAVRTQEGCVRFSYVPPGSRTPRRYRCQPDLAVARALVGVPEAERAAVASLAEQRVRPSFSSRRYGRPDYVQLRLRCPNEIAAGGEDGAEMGVLNHLKQHQRIANLERRLREYLPFGLEPGVIYVT